MLTDLLNAGKAFDNFQKYLKETYHQPLSPFASFTMLFDTRAITGPETEPAVNEWANGSGHGAPCSIS